MLEHTFKDYEDQMALEELSAQEGVKRYREQLLKAGAENSGSGLALMARVIPTFAESIQSWVDTTKENKISKYGPLVSFLDEFEGDYESIAFLTCQVALSAINKTLPLTAATSSVARRLETELEYRHLQSEAPGLYHKLMTQLKNTAHERHRRNVIIHTKNKCGIARDKWTKERGIQLGGMLLHMLSDSNLLIQIEMHRERGKTKYMITPTPECDEWMKQSHARCELLAPVFMPMVVPPRPWRGVRGGGYLNQTIQKLKLVKTRNSNYLEELSHAAMPEVYEAINTLQETPWKVNNAVLKVMREAWDSGDSIGKLPATEDTPFPAKPVDIATNNDARDAWKMEVAKIRQMNLRLKSKRISVSSQLMVAERFKEKEAIYYVWTIDWRGRAYPLASFMHPQADDSGKSLLQFSEGKPLGESGGYWLAVHIAGLFGIDKCSFDERVRWVQDHQEEILDSAISPLDGQRFWCEADKPWCALAACMEWMGFTISGNDYVSHLPVAMDGSCNGLQNFSAVLRDEIGGKAVNLLPNDTPQDIYTEVMNVVIAKLPADSKWNGKVTRKIVKRPVMTLPYGASQFGMRQQIIEEVTKIEEETGVSYLDTDEKDTYQQCGELAAIVYNSIGEVVIAARQAMDWLQAVARIAAKDGLPIHWHTPMGFPVLQNYYESDVKRVRVMMGTQQISLRTQVDSTRINKRRMAQGIAPNVVHSWDAAHMMRTILKCKDAGIDSFSMIHDSYGTHACDVETMGSCLREAFIEQYTPDLLEEFKQEIIKQLPDKLIEKLPDIPAKGTLDLSLVQQSEFFFA